MAYVVVDNELKNYEAKTKRLIAKGFAYCTKEVALNAGDIEPCIYCNVEVEL